MAPPPPAARRRRANSREQKKVPSRTIWVMERQPLGEIFSAGAGKLPAALLISRVTGPRACSMVSKAAAIWPASRISAAAPTAVPPQAATAWTPFSRCSGLRLRMPTLAPARANSTAMALPRPVPPPGTITVWPAKLSLLRKTVPAGGGGCSAMVVPRWGCGLCLKSGTPQWTGALGVSPDQLCSSAGAAGSLAGFAQGQEFLGAEQGQLQGQLAANGGAHAIGPQLVHQFLGGEHGALGVAGNARGDVQYHGVELLRRHQKVRQPPV